MSRVCHKKILLKQPRIMLQGGVYEALVIQIDHAEACVLIPARRRAGTGCIGHCSDGLFFPKNTTID
jgi:hypothetical protein